LIKFRACLFIILVSFILNSCAQKTAEEVLSPTQAHKKLIKLCKEEYNLNVVTKAFNNTLWIYLPLDKAYLSLGSSKEGPSKSADPYEKLIIKYLDGEFSENTFHLNFDIGLSTSYTDYKGITTKATEEYSAIQQHLLGAINRAYGDVEKKPGSNRYVESVPGDRDFVGQKENATHKALVHSYVKTDLVPDFFVIVIADIFNGIETRMYLHLQDLRRAFTDQGFGEEYIKRLIVDQPIGHAIIVGDTNGEHLNAYDITWPEFLTKQMINRTMLKYTFSAFPPSEDTIEQLTQIAAETIQAYDFNEFNSLQLSNLESNTTKSISKTELQNILITPPRLPGKIHKIKFKIGAPEEDQIVN